MVYDIWHMMPKFDLGVICLFLLTNQFNLWINNHWFLEMNHKITSFCVFSSKKFAFLNYLAYFCKRKYRTGSIRFIDFLPITKVK